MKIVIVEDDIWMREELQDIYEKKGYEVISITTFLDATQQILTIDPDMVLLDLNLPGVTGFEICREIKKKLVVPVLVLTSRDQLSDELHALDLGADEYLTKPCHKDRLLARTHNLLKRYEGKQNLLDGQTFKLDSQTFSLYKDGKAVLLTEKEGTMLEVFMTHQEEIVSREQLCLALWGTVKYIDDNALQVNMTRLRKSLREFGLEHRIETVRGVGYRFRKEPPE